MNLLVGDYSSRGDGLTQLLWMRDLYAQDLSLPDMIQFPYERDDGLVTSWVNHVLCSNHNSTIVPHIASCFYTVFHRKRERRPLFSTFCELIL